MALTKQSDSKVIFLQVKNYSLWQELKQPVEGCDQIEVTNPRTKEVLTKYGYSFRTVTGCAVKLEKYDREHQGTRYFGFKLHLRDADDQYSIDMPYHSQILRRFLRTAATFDWSQSVSISAFKSKGGKGETAQTGIWFQQGGETVRPYYSKEQPRGCPQAVQDPDTHDWDFKQQHRWLIERLKEDTIPAIDKAAQVTAPPVEPEHELQEEPQLQEMADVNPGDFITDDDCPF